MRPSGPARLRLSMSAVVVGFSGGPAHDGQDLVEQADRVLRGDRLVSWPQTAANRHQDA